MKKDEGRKLSLVIIDGNNFERMIRTLSPESSMVDFKKLRQVLTAGERTPKTWTRYYFAAKRGYIMNKSEFIQSKRWWVITRTSSPVYDKGEEQGLKGDMDVEITWDVATFLIKYRARIKRLVLVSGDRDFCKLVEEAHRREIPVVVIASHFNIAAQLRAALRDGDTLTMLETILPAILVENGQGQDRESPVSSMVREADRTDNQ